MKHYNPKLIRSGPALLAALFVAAATVAGAQARRPIIRSGPQRTFVAGEIVLYAYPGTPLADVQKAASVVQPASITPLLLPDCYQIWLPTSRRDDADTLSAVATLKADPHVRWVGPSRLYYPLQASTSVPNDPLYPQQWNLPLINMPQAWVLQKGQPNNNVAWIDTGYDPKHVDAVGQFLVPGSYDFADNDTDITADGTGTDFDHGTHTSGIAIAITNNSTGIAGIDWANIKCVGLKVSKKGSNTDQGLDFTAILQSYAYIAAQKDNLHIVACNMSYGGQGNPSDTSDPEYQGIQACVNKGVIMVAAAGNSSGDNTEFVPAGYPFVVTVSAVNPKGLLTYYSSFGKVDLAAPGGEQYNTDTDPNGILSLKQNNAYGFAQGTSDAAPHVTAVAALMMSTPGVTPQLAVQAMEQTANRTNVAGGVPDTKYGYGLLDAYHALLKVSVNVQILQPEGVDPTGQNAGSSGIVPPLETLKPLLMFKLGNVPPANFTITIDGNSFTWADIQNNAVPGVSAVLTPQGNTTGDNPSYTIGFRYTFPSTAPYQHTISISGTNPQSGTTSTDTRIITIQPHTLPAGMSFISIPYYEDPQSSPTGQFRNASQLLGPNVTLFRWINTQVPNTTSGAPVTIGKYAVYGPGSTDPLAAYASFLPPDVTPKLEPLTDPVTGISVSDPRPLGLAWFAQLPGPTPVLTYGTDLPNQAVKIPLHEGWNMVGDPFRFQVPFNAAQIEQPNGTRMSIAAAVDQKLILPLLYHLVGGQYQFDTLPGGTFNPWEGHWVYVVPQNPGSVQSGNTLFLIIPPTQISGGTSGTQAALKRSTVFTRSMGVAGTGGWSVQLEARTRNLGDSYNYIGMSAHATSGNDATKVPKPPMPTPYVSLGIVRPSSPAGVYAQDLQPLGGAKSWDVVVATDQADSDVILSWEGMTSVPRNYRLTLTDKTSGQTVDMRQQASFKFHTGHPATSHSFVVTARPTVPEGRALLTGIFINPSRSAGGRAASAYEIGYTVTQDAHVDISIMSLDGRMLAQISPSRAVTSGQNSVIWNGLDSTGRALPANTYALQIRAVTASGDVTRLVHPFLVTGR